MNHMTEVRVKRVNKLKGFSRISSVRVKRSQKKVVLIERNKEHRRLINSIEIVYPPVQAKGLGMKRLPNVFQLTSRLYKKVLPIIKNLIVQVEDVSVSIAFRVTGSLFNEAKWEQELILVKKPSRPFNVGGAIAKNRSLLRAKQLLY